MTRFLAGLWLVLAFVYGFAAGFFHERLELVAFYLFLLVIAIANGAFTVINTARSEGHIEQMDRDAEMYR